VEPEHPMKHAMIAFLSVALLTGLASAADVKPGPVELTFAERSPLTDPKSLATRLKLPATDTVDYDLTTEHFHVYIPKGADAAKPMGLIVLACYKEAEGLPRDIFPELDAANCALVVPKEFLDKWYNRAGVCLDAEFNMRNQFPIDPKRVYVFGGGDHPDKDGTQTMVAPRMGLFFPDVFTGTFTTQVQPYRAVQAPGGGQYTPAIPKPDGAQFGLAKSHPLVLAEGTDQQKLFLNSYKADGFKFTKIIPVNQDQFHYPHFQAGWLPDVLKFMDESTAKLKLPTAATTKPAK
jgi:hypothetical protein